MVPVALVRGVLLVKIGAQCLIKGAQIEMPVELCASKNACQRIEMRAVIENGRGLLNRITL